MGFYARNLLLGLSIFAGFVFITSFLALLLQSSLPAELCSCTPWAWMPYLVPILSSLGLFVGGVVFYLTDTWARQRKNRIEEENALNRILSCLPKEEAGVIKLLRDGPKTQSKISKELGLSKVKTHRIIKRLESKGIIKIEKKGKTNLVSLV